jgi:hypothetical protein
MLQILGSNDNEFAFFRLSHVYNYYCNWQCLESFQKCYSSADTYLRNSTKLRITLQIKFSFISGVKHLNFYHSIHVMLKIVI